MSLLKKIMSFWRISFKHKILFMINFLLCGFARAAINIFPLKYLTPYFGQFQKTLTISTLISDKQRRQASLIGRAVRLAAKYTPWDSSCLTQAMVAKFWCRLYRIPYVFYIGFAKSETEPSGYMAHAWVAAGPVRITGGDGLTHYHVVSTYVYFGKGRYPVCMPTMPLHSGSTVS
jgi:hypothetical protein